MSWVAVAVIGGSVIGGLVQSNAAKNAAGQASSAANNATNAQLGMFNTTNQQSAPWRQAGQNALNQIGVGFGTATPQGISASSAGPFADPAANAEVQRLLANPSGPTDLQGIIQQVAAGWNQVPTAQGGPQAVQPPQTGDTSLGGINQGQFNHQFNAQDLQTNLAPNYQWQLDQGLGALQNSQAGKSGLVSGNAMRGLNDYAQNFASNAYQNAFNNYNTQQSNIFNRLSTIAGLGSASANNNAGVGAQTGAGMANSMIAGGQAQAAGTVGSANALAGGLNNATGSWYGLNMLKQSGSTPVNYFGGDGGTFNPQFEAG